MKLSNIILGTLLLLTSTLSSAALVQTDFTLTVTSTDHSDITVWDVFTVSSVYDDESTRMSQYNDEANGVGEYGEGDDTLRLVWCIGSGAGCNISSNQFNFFADANIDISSFEAGITQWERGRDNSTFSQSRMFADNNGFYFDIIRDDMWFYGNTSYGMSATLITYSQGRDVVSNFDITSFQTRAVAPNPIPEPSIIALMGLGLAGMGIARRCKAQSV